MNNKVPFLDLITPHLELEGELISVVRDVLRSASFVGGIDVQNFEEQFAQFCDVKYCVGVANGTDAVRFALMAAGVRPGDAVLTVSHTFIATAEAISQAGAVPEFVDIDERTYNIDVDKLREYLETQCDLDPLTKRPISRRSGRVISAVVPVHLYGQMADMDPILDLCETYHLVVVEDAAQAHGAEYFSRRENRWRKAGSIGKTAAFSFYPGKNLGACGEAGAVTTNDPALAKKVRQLRDHGQAEKYFHDMEGYNGRLDTMQAGFLRVKLAHLSRWNEARRGVAETYQQLFSGVEGIVLPYEPSWSRAVYHLYVIRVSNREDLQSRLKIAGIASGIHYPVPLHLQQAYRTLHYREGDLPITERVAREIVSLPMFPGLTRAQQESVVEVVLAHVGLEPADSIS